VFHVPVMSDTRQAGDLQIAGIIMFRTLILPLCQLGSHTLPSPPLSLTVDGEVWEKHVCTLCTLSGHTVLYHIQNIYTILNKSYLLQSRIEAQLRGLCELQSTGMDLHFLQSEAYSFHYGVKAVPLHLTKIELLFKK